MRDSTRRSPGQPSGPTDLAPQVERLRGDLLARLYYITEALEDGDTDIAHAVVLDAIDDLRAVIAA